MPDPEYITAPKAARLLGLGADSVHRLCDGGVLEFIVPAKQRRIRYASVIEYREKVTRGRRRAWAGGRQYENLLRD